METDKNSVEYEKTYTAAIRALGLRMHACRELSRKLHEKGYSEKNIAPVIAELLELGYLNDVEYAKSYIGLSYDKLKGKRRIEKELIREKLTRKLLAKGFSMDITYKAVESVLKINTDSWQN